MDNAFIKDIKNIREHAKRHLSDGAVTSRYKLDLELLINLLNMALASETICTLRYKKHYFKAKALGAHVAANELLEHAQQENEHVDLLAQRIQQLGGEPNLDPTGITERSYAEYVSCDDLQSMINENLIAERIAIDIYREMIKYVGNEDPTTRALLEGILAIEEEHADDLLEVAAEYKISFDG